MDFELRAAREKLEREQRTRKEAAKRKLEAERRAKTEATRRREAIEAAQRTRRLEDARAKELVQQKMEESLFRGGGVMFCRTFEAMCYDGYGDKIKLPPSSFSELSGQGALDKGPMYFRLSKIDGSSHVNSESGNFEERNRVTHSGVLEFTANEGSVELPPHVWDNLCLNNDVAFPLIEVQYVSLPKGIYAKLQPIGLGFSDIPNHKAVLETSLRRHATLSEGDIITVKHGNFIHKLCVLELKPSSSVSVLETDVEVDVVEADNVSDNTEEHTLKLLMLGKVEHGIVHEGEFIYYKFSIDENISGKISSGELNLQVHLEAETSEGDTDIYVSRHPFIFPTQHQHEWSSHDIGSKFLVLNSKDKLIVPGVYSIGIFGFKGSTNYKISVAVTENSRMKLGETVGSLSEVNPDSKECQNCRRYISTKSIMIHEAYCVRHNVACQHDGCSVILRKEEAGNHVHCGKCGQGLQKREMEKHLKVFHEPLTCSCGITLEKKEMVEHQSSTCPLRLITCRFCGDMFPAGITPVDARDRLRGLSEHESLCGSRTAPCHSCGRSVMLKDMDIHIVAVHQQN